MHWNNQKASWTSLLSSLQIRRPSLAARLMPFPRSLTFRLPFLRTSSRFQFKGFHTDSAVTRCTNKREFKMQEERCKKCQRSAFRWRGQVSFTRFQLCSSSSDCPWVLCTSGHFHFISDRPLKTVQHFFRGPITSAFSQQLLKDRINNCYSFLLAPTWVRTLAIARWLHCKDIFCGSPSLGPRELK